MRYSIHRGTHEIGGSCVEVWTETTRIIIDIGMPLANKDGTDFDFSKYRTHSSQELIREGILPEVRGLYSPSGKKIAGLLISHAHLDHYGLYEYAHSGVKFYLGEPTHKLIELTSLFSGRSHKITNYQYFETGKPVRISDITVTPYLMDHSAFNAHALLIEAGSKSIFYSGDFRSHGRKWKTFRWFKHNCPKGVDYLLLEGTTLGSQPFKPKSEELIEEEAFKLFSERGKINLVYTSGQNIDRIVSFYKACRKLKKAFVIDVYVANILEAISKYADVPHPNSDFPEVRVYFPQNICSILGKADKKDLFYQFRRYKITKQEISNNMASIVMLVRPSMRRYLEGIQNLQGGNLIYSLWSGYRGKKATSDFLNYLKSKGFQIFEMHTGGHAGLRTLQEMVDAVQPKAIVPIHTFGGDSYKDSFNVPVRRLKDGEIVCL
jgi:ribonuclease J